MGDRSAEIVQTLVDAFADLMAADPAAFRTKFRKMAADPFAFYRGSACLFYADVADRDQLRAVHEEIAANGMFVSYATRVLIEARRWD